jgi:hypothetical protein
MMKGNAGGEDSKEGPVMSKFEKKDEVWERREGEQERR